MLRRPRRDYRSRRETLTGRDLSRGPGLPFTRRSSDPGRMREVSILGGPTNGGVRRFAGTDPARFGKAPIDGNRGNRANYLSEVDPRSDDEITDALYGHLRGGRADKACGLIQLLFLAGRSVAQIVDGALRRALERMGEDWNGHDVGDASWEQRAVQICIRILHELSAATPLPRAAPVAVGAAPTRDAYILPAMSAAAVLTSVGFRATNLGPQTPTATLVQTIHDLRPSLVWLSITAELESDELEAEVDAILAAVESVGAMLTIGGIQAHSFRPPSHPRVLLCDSMVELAALATGLSQRIEPSGR